MLILGVARVQTTSRARTAPVTPVSCALWLSPTTAGTSRCQDALALPRTSLRVANAARVTPPSARYVHACRYTATLVARTVLPHRLQAPSGCLLAPSNCATTPLCRLPAAWSCLFTHTSHGSLQSTPLPHPPSVPPTSLAVRLAVAGVPSGQSDALVQRRRATHHAASA